MIRLRNTLFYLGSLFRPIVRLERTPERYLLPVVYAILSLLCILACSLPIKISRGEGYAVDSTDGHLVAHIAQGDMANGEFSNKIFALIKTLGQNESIETVEVSAGNDLINSMTVLFGEVALVEHLYGGIVRIDLIEKVGKEANLEDLQFAISEFHSAQIDDFRVWKKAGLKRTYHATLLGYLFALLISLLALVILALTVRLSLRMQSKTLNLIHQLGATDSFSSLIFQSITLQRSLIGTTIGSFLGAGCLVLIDSILEIQGYVGAAHSGPAQFILLLLVPLGLTALSVLVARQVALQFLRKRH